MSRDFSRESWRLKLKRAEKHLKELEGQLRAYGDRRSYEAQRQLQSKRDHNVWRYILSMAKEVDPEIAITLGDVVHNLRTALDHIAVAIVPREARKSAGFPIENRNLWAKEGGSFRLRSKTDIDGRQAFKQRIKAMPLEAQAIIKSLQPYRRTPPELHGLYLLNRFENADKHRNLIPAFLGLVDVTVRATVPEPNQRTSATFEPLHYDFCEDGAKLFQAEIPSGHTPEAEMYVEISGTPIITVDIGLPTKYANVVETLRLIAKHTTEHIFPALEPFVRT